RPAEIRDVRIDPAGPTVAPARQDDQLVVDEGEAARPGHPCRDPLEAEGRASGCPRCRGRPGPASRGGDQRREVGDDLLLPRLADVGGFSARPDPLPAALLAGGRGLATLVVAA